MKKISTPLNTENIGSFRVGPPKNNTHMDITLIAKKTGELSIQCTLKNQNEVIRSMTFTRKAENIIDTVVKRNENGSLELTRLGIQEMKRNRDLMLKRPDAWGKEVNHTTTNDLEQPL
ncbi:MAG: hypothetical protein ACRBDI_04110 [Alphaproteobacteria bacterium]